MEQTNLFQGKIIKGIAGFYYVHSMKTGIFECKAKGLFRKEKIKPLVGDDVIVEIVDGEEKVGNIVQILPRKNALVRPEVVNIDQVLIVCAITHPLPNLRFLDNLIINVRKESLPFILCFNKEDMASGEDIAYYTEIYKNCGGTILVSSAKTEQGTEKLYAALRGKMTAIAGASGVGKSSLINIVQSAVSVETGSISEKTRRGKHTTRHSEIIPVDDDTYIMDTPGFTSVRILIDQKEELKYYYEEFKVFEGECRFSGCNHISEPGCRVKEAVTAREIPEERYHTYKEIYGEIENRRRY